MPDNFFGIVNTRNQTLQFMVQKDKSILIDIPIIENGDYIGSKQKISEISECIAIVTALREHDDFYTVLPPAEEKDLKNRPKWKFW